MLNIKHWIWYNLEWEENMIGRITLTRIEPCFMANKPASGELARIKKDSPAQNKTSAQNNPNKPSNADSFTSSVNDKTDNKKTDKIKN